MSFEDLIKKITEKKEFSQLPRKDVVMALEKFDRRNLNDYQKVKLTRQFLRKIFSGFSSRKIFSESKKEKSAKWCLMKHKSSKERVPYCGEIYQKCFNGLDNFTIVDFGAGINGLSFLNYKKKRFSYVGIEAIGQFVDLMNSFFKKDRINATAVQASLFELDKIKKIVSGTKKPRVGLMFKVVDSLESVERDYSKKFIGEIFGYFDRMIVSFATHSLGARKKFTVQRGWLWRFIKNHFSIVDDFELGGERYLVFAK